MIFRKTIAAGQTGDTEPLVLTTATLLLAIVFVVPGLFDTTLTSRLAVYPICAVLLLFAGRRAVPAWALAGTVFTAVVSITWTILAPIPLQGVIPSIRWISFSLMLAGAAGIYRGYGSCVIWKSLTAAALAAAVIQLFGGSEWIWGNSNRPGVLLALGAVLALRGDLFRRKYAGILCALLMVAALISTGFITGWIAAAMGIVWGMKPPKWKIHHAVPVFLFLLFQILFTSIPSLAGRISPSLEIRTRIWRTGIQQLARTAPAGTGTGQSRLTLFMEAGPEVQLLAGDPDKRVDHLHSDLLTPAVEWGAAGLVLLALVAWMVIRRKNLPRLQGSVLLCLLPFAAVDLPLATPLGALPLALGLGVVMDPPAGKKSIRFPLTVTAVLAAAGLLWCGLILRGYRLLEKGRISAVRSNAEEEVILECFEGAAELIPFEERSWLFLARAYLDHEKTIAAENAARRFNSIYPSYWKGWQIQALSEAASGRDSAAAVSCLNALRTAPVTLQNRSELALNAAAIPPASLEDALLIGESYIYSTSKEIDETPDMTMERIRRLVMISEFLQEREHELASDILLEAMRTMIYFKERSPAVGFGETALIRRMTRLSDSIGYENFQILLDRLQYPSGN